MKPSSTSHTGLRIVLTIVIAVGLLVAAFVVFLHFERAKAKTFAQSQIQAMSDAVKTSFGTGFVNSQLVIGDPTCDPVRHDPLYGSSGGGCLIDLTYFQGTDTGVSAAVLSQQNDALRTGFMAFTADLKSRGWIDTPANDGGGTADEYDSDSYHFYANKYERVNRVNCYAFINVQKKQGSATASGTITARCGW